jgi:hypothetical protein
MKKINLIFSITFLLLITNVFAQHPILEQNKEWKNICEIYPHNNYTTWDEFYKTGDSVFMGSHYYTKVIFNYIHSSIDTALLREEGQKTFRLIGTEEVLLYDFGLHIGDSVYRSASDSSYFKCVAIDSVLVDGVYAKRLSVNQTWGYSTKWVEGVGDETFGVLGVTDPLLGNHTQFRCVKVNQNPIYSIDGNCSSLSVDQIQETVNMNNPVYDNLQVAFNGIKYSAYQLISIEGRVVAGGKLENMDNLNVDLRQFPNGLYIAVFEKKSGERQSYRLMKL